MHGIFSQDTDVALATLPAPEIVEMGERSGSVLVIPVGSVEQHGAHLPVATDSILASAVAVGAAEAVSDEMPVLVAPPVWSGYSPHHLPFGGTATAEFETLHRLLEEVAGSLLENAFDALLLVNGHGGNKALVSAAVSSIGRDHPGVEALGLTYFDLAREGIESARESNPGGMAHAGEFETALMRHLHPDLVDTDRIEGTPLAEPYDQGGTDLTAPGSLAVYRPFDEYSDSGAIGSPELATAENGELFYEAVVDELSELLRAVHDRNR